MRQIRENFACETFPLYGMSLAAEYKNNKGTLLELCNHGLTSQ
jgi:hypothetical protein